MGDLAPISQGPQADTVVVRTDKWLGLLADERGIRMLLNAPRPRWLHQLRLLRQMRREEW